MSSRFKVEAQLELGGAHLNKFIHVAILGVFDATLQHTVSYETI